MMKSTKEILIERGYPESAAMVTSSNLSKLTGRFLRAIDRWLVDETESDLDSHGYSSKELMARFKGMTYPAAVLTLDWLEREPEKAKRTIEQGIR